MLKRKLTTLEGKMQQGCKRRWNHTQEPLACDNPVCNNRIHDRTRRLGKPTRQEATANDVESLRTRMRCNAATFNVRR